MIQQCSADICFQSSPRRAHPFPLYSTVLCSITFPLFSYSLRSIESVVFNSIAFHSIQRQLDFNESVPKPFLNSTHVLRVCVSLRPAQLCLSQQDIFQYTV